jgi:AcrR family transcriptional regulator
MNSIFGESLLPGEIEELLLRGFVPSGKVLAHGERKQLAVKIRARCFAVDVALGTGVKTPLREVAEMINVTERSLRTHFRHKEDLFAFPPPEIATALAFMTVGAESWLKVRELTERLLSDLDANPQGRFLILRLVELHQREPRLGASDNHFAHELRHQLSCISKEFKQRPGEWVGFFTDGFRSSLVQWSLRPNEPLISVADRVFALLDPLILVQQSSEWAEQQVSVAGVADAKTRQKLEHS